MEYSKKQQEACVLLKEKTHSLLYGGSRSGKTFFLISIIMIRALKYPKSRHLIVRLRYNHARISLWLDTIPKVMAMLGIPAKAFTKSESDLVIRFFNGSEVWIDGLDDKERVEKILGREYNTIFFNEISQIPYSSVSVALTRLALRIPGCRNVAYYDCNPTGRTHWGYKLFVLGIDPESGRHRADYGHFGNMQINPHDNAANLADGYIQNTLENLPESKRKRFLLGEWSDPEGVIFTNWDVIEDIPAIVRERAKRSLGLDFGYSIDPAALVDLYQTGDELYIDELLYEQGLVNDELYKQIMLHNPPVVWSDREPKTIEEFHRKGMLIKPAYKGPDSVRHGIDWLKSKTMHVTRRSQNIIMELENYVWMTDKNGLFINQPIDDYNHAIDALRYGANQFTSMRSTAASIL